MISVTYVVVPAVLLKLCSGSQQLSRDEFIVVIFKCGEYRDKRRRTGRPFEGRQGRKDRGKKDDENGQLLVEGGSMRTRWAGIFRNIVAC